MQHLDHFGQPLALGDCVAYPRGNQMMVGTILKLNPKLVGIKSVASKWGDCNKYSQQLIRLSGPEVTMYLLKRPTSKTTK
jgi:hypothetical protein